MTKAEAQRQIEAFFRRLGEKKASFFEQGSSVSARIGETVVGFEYDDDEQLLSAQTLIYRFREEPQDRVLDAIFAEEIAGNTGGGRLVFNSENHAFYLQKDFDEPLGDALFNTEINRLAQASLRWSAEILMSAAEKAGS